MKYNILITSRPLIYACTITLVKYCLSVDHSILIMLWIACVKLVGELSDQNYVKHATSHLTAHTPQATLPRVLLPWHWSKLTDSVYMMCTSLTSYMARLQTRIKIGREGANALCLDWTWKINPVYLPSNDRFVKKFFYCFKKKDWCWIHGEGVRSSVRVCEGVRSSARLQPRKWWHLQR